MKIGRGIIVRLSTIFCLFITAPAYSQQNPSWNAAEIAMAIEKLNVLGSVLYVAAHPDDENTRLITYYANEEKFRTAYLSLTRGDGGQNLIGPQLRESLGIIRTQELLAARRIDGGQQFFTRANDFGYSKSAEETFNIWDRDKILADVVWVIRKFRPDVIITRFNTESGRTHGHHTASAILAKEAFHLAADPEAFPEQLNYVDTWQPKRLFWNTSWWFYGSRDFDKSGLLAVDVGLYNPLLGESYTEIAAESRSQHRSQGFGATPTRGSSVEYLQQWEGPPASQHIMEGIASGWSRVDASGELEQLTSQLKDRFNPFQPAAIVPDLLRIRQKISGIQDSFWRRIKLQEVDDLISQCTGLYLEAAAGSYAITPADSVRINIEAVNRSGLDVQLKEVFIPQLNLTYSIDNPTLGKNSKLEKAIDLFIPDSILLSQPYWLREPGTKGTFRVKDQQLIGLPENPPALQARFSMDIQGAQIVYTRPVEYKSTDPAKGEVYRPVQIVPEVVARFDKEVYIFADAQPKQVSLILKAGKNDLQGTVSLDIPEHWKASPVETSFRLEEEGEEIMLDFTITPPSSAGTAFIKAKSTVNGKTWSLSAIDIAFDHIPEQTWFPDASSRIIRLDIKKKGQKIGYIEGVGDAIPLSLEEVGYQVEYLQEDDFTSGNLEQYDAIITGIRAFNANEKLPFHQSALMQYVENGGTLIVQYNTSYGLATQQIGPYPFTISRERVTVEEAPVTILEPAHPALTGPNTISQEDFDGWVQERGLYFADQWDDKLVPLLGSQDPGEPLRKGGLLVGQYGKGYFVYTGYSWFRQLPAGVPGAYRIFTNLISLGKN